MFDPLQAARISSTEMSPTCKVYIQGLESLRSFSFKKAIYFHHVVLCTVSTGEATSDWCFPALSRSLSCNNQRCVAVVSADWPVKHRISATWCLKIINQGIFRFRAVVGRYAVPPAVNPLRNMFVQLRVNESRIVRESTLLLEPQFFANWFHIIDDCRTGILTMLENVQQKWLLGWNWV